MTKEILDFLLNFFQVYGYFAVFGVLLICGFGLPVPEDVALVAGGAIAGRGYANVHLMLFISMLGVLMGDGLVYAAGYFLGERVHTIPGLRRILSPKRYEKVQEYFERYGTWVVFIGRFTPGLRTPIFLTAGITRRVGFLRFLLTDGTAALISVPVWIYLGYFGGKNIDTLITKIEAGERGVLIAVATVVAGVIGAIIYKTKKNRQKAA